MASQICPLQSNSLVLTYALLRSYLYTLLGPCQLVVVMLQWHTK